MIEYDNIIKNKIQLLKQLRGLKKDEIINMRSFVNFTDIFQKDVHALRIAIRYIKEK